MMNHNRCSNVATFIAIIAFLSTTIKFSQAMWNDFELGAMQNMNESSAAIDFNLKTKRVNRTTYGVTGTIGVKGDQEKFEVEVKVYVSSLGNDQYILYPFKISRTPVCKVINNEYRKYLMDEFTKTSDLPASNDDDMCPLFLKKTYSIKDYLFDTTNIPRFMQAGWYKIHILLYENTGSTVVSGLEMNAHLY